MKVDRQKYLEQIKETALIQNRLVSESQNFDNATKEAFIYNSNRIKQITENKLTLAQLKQVTNELLTFWKESIGPDVEAFWIELENRNIEFERKDELNFALLKGRFRRVEQGISARKSWSIIKDSDSITRRFTHAEIEKIEEIIQKDEEIRLTILKKCLLKNSIPKSQYLKFGECMAYFGQCNLFDSHFSKSEVDKLNLIWKGFRF
ncbi:hypothetical protein [Ekhidna sp.]